MGKLSFIDRFAATLVGAVGYLIIALVWRTLRIEQIDTGDIERCPGETKRRIFVFWHGELLTLAYAHRNAGICVLVSRHRDGESIAKALQRLGFRVVRGSSTGGGLEGLFEMCTSVREGRDLAIAPDGPRGPRHMVQPGVLYLAQRAGVVVVPTACATARRIVLNTWDRFEIPLPFSRVVVAHGRPLEVPRDLGVSATEEHTRRLEEALAKVGEEARTRVLSTGRGRVSRSRAKRPS
ncbi:MAG: lysophospholipid acyltransferase family protein [Candidatus Eisenbacteria bacterium]|nr:lysophospholipid acyltransferase family protein [Candidatus Eisenbacteria bacterium]